MNTLVTTLRGPGAPLAGLLAILTLMVFRPPAAYPVVGSWLLLALLGLAAGGWLYASWVGAMHGRPRALVFSTAFAVLWGLYWCLAKTGGSPPQGYDEIMVGWSGTVGFVAGVAGFRLAGFRSHLDRTGPGETIPAGVLVLGWLAGFGGLLGLHGLYQVYGPATLPGTFGALEAGIMASREAYAPEIYEGLLHHVREGRASSLFGQANLYAGFLASAATAALWLLSSGGRSHRFRAAWGGVAVLCILGILASGSRGGAVAFVGGVFFLVVARVLPLRRFARSGAMNVVVWPVLLVGVGDFFVRLLSGGTVRQRLMYWDTAWQVWSENLVFGRGPGMYEILYAQHRVPMAQETQHAHSWFFQWGAEGGLVALGLFLGWIALAKLAAFRGAGSKGWAGGGMLAVAGALGLHGLVDFTFAHQGLWLLFVLLVAGAAVSGPFDDPAADEAAASARSRPGLGASLYVVIALVWWWFLQFTPAMAAYHREGFELYARAGETALARESLEKALGWMPGDDRLVESDAQVLFHSGDVEGALARIGEAIALRPESSRLRATRARMLMETGSTEEALEEQRAAIALHPLDGQRRLEYAQMLWELGRRDEARPALDQARVPLFTRPEEALYERLCAEWGVAPLPPQSP